MLRENAHPIVNAAFLAEIKEGNAPLWQELDAWRELVDRPVGLVSSNRESLRDRNEPPSQETAKNPLLWDASDFGNRLLKLRQAVLDEFAVEETYGFMTNSRFLSEQIHHMAAQALEEHRQLSLILMEVCEQVGEFAFRGTLLEHWEAVRNQLNDFLRKLAEHEKRESALVKVSSLVR